jgi:hypothetical protein
MIINIFFVFLKFHDGAICECNILGDSMMYHTSTANTNGNCSATGTGSSPNSSTPPNINAAPTPPLSTGQQTNQNDANKFNDEMVKFIDIKYFLMT